MRLACVLILPALLFSPALAQVPCSDLPAASCEIPALFTHVATVESSGIRTTLATLKDSYWPGDLIPIKLVFENTSLLNKCLNWEQDPIDFVFVLPDACDPLRPDCANDLIRTWPESVVTGPGAGVGLAPGECRVFEYEWDTGAEFAPAGTHTVLAGLFELTWDEEFGHFNMPPGGITLEVTISIPSDGETDSFGMMKARFR